MKLGTVLLLAMLLIFIAYTPDGCGSFESPAKYTAKYEYHIGGFWGQTYYTDNYTLTSDFFTAHGWWNKYHDKESIEDAVIPISEFNGVTGNPSFGKLPEEGENGK